MPGWQGTGLSLQKLSQRTTEPRAVKTESLTALGFLVIFAHRVKETELERSFPNSLPSKLSVFKQLCYEMEISCYDQTIWLI